MPLGDRLLKQIGITPETLKQLQEQAKQSQIQFQEMYFNIAVILEILKLEHGTAKFEEAKQVVLERLTHE